jgi:hypothetical protein
MTRNTDSTTRLEKPSRKIVITREEQLKRVCKAVLYMEEHGIVATRANIASVASRFWIVRPRLLEQAMRIMAEEDLS